MKKLSCLSSLLAVFALVGCATSYSWTPRVPEKMRTVAVPTFRNESDLSEMGAVATRQVLRELQREGTFSIRRADEAALEIQGVVKSVSTGDAVTSRRTLARAASSEMTAEVEVSVIDKRAGRVLVEAKMYRPRTTLMANGDMTTAKRDASGRLADDLARAVVDDLLNMKWSKE